MPPGADAEDPMRGTKYRTLSLLGSGGMGEVFVVEHRELKKTYAAKLLRSALVTDERTVDRMRLEANALARLEHENIVQIHDFDVTPDGLPFIVMDLLQGETLREALVRLGSIEPTQALVFALHMLNGLDAVHGIGVVHRDLKPGNLFIHRTPDGRSILKLLDFGVARVVPGISNSAPAPLVLPTRTGTSVGTPLFMSPEAASGQAVDTRSDIYSAANIIYMMLTGRGPFDDLGIPAKILEAHVGKEPPPPSQFAHTWLPQKLEAIVLKGLAKDPGDRFQTAGDFARAVFDVLQAYEQLRTAGQIPKVDPNRARIGATSAGSSEASMLTVPGKPRRAPPQPDTRWRYAVVFLLLFVTTVAIGRFGIRLLLR